MIVKGLTRYPTVTEDAILGFFQEYRFLSNFEPCSVTLDGIVYPSSEHAYMAEKSTNTDERAKIAALATPLAARKYGVNMYISTPRWEQVKFSAMYRVVRQKFIENPSLMFKLKATGSRYLEETNNWGDDYWGRCSARGHNHLGQILMLVRDYD